MWTNEQLAAIEQKNANLLISAAAGSGKTAVLVERIIQMILSGETSVEKLLVVTYTNAAAGEMRARIEKALSEAIESNRGDKDYLHDQIKRLSRSSIKTFHAFCLDVIRSHFQRIDIDPSFRMANETERLLLVEEAIDETLEKAYESLNPDFVAFVESYSSNRDDVKIRQMVLKVHQFVLSNPDPKGFLKTLEAMYLKPLDSVGQVWESVLLKHFEDQLEQAVIYLDEGIDMCLWDGGPLPYKTTLEADRLGIEALLEACQIGLKALEQSISNFKFDRIATLKKAEKENILPEYVEMVKNHIRDKILKKEILEPIKKFFDYKSVDRFRQEVLENAAHIQVLCDLTGKFDAAYSGLKRDKNLMDFSDLEHFAVSILEDETICSAYRSAFDSIFVDEYQDASGIQERIVRRIQREDNVFMVGDVKQSIYKFRLADPTLFLEKYKSYDRYEHWHKNNYPTKTLRIDLKNNFRTRKSILDAVNDLFETIMSERLGDIAYDESAKLYGKMAFEETQVPHIEAIVVSKKASSEEEALDEPIEQLKSDELEARCVASKIASLIGTPVFFPKTNETKPCAYRDIVILLRSLKSWTPVFEQVFLEEGIPLYADSQTGYFDTLEIKWLMSVLKVVDNPYNDLDWLIVMRSPLVGLPIETLSALKEIPTEKPFYYERCKTFASTNQMGSDAVKKFICDLKRWQAAATYMPLDALIWQIVYETGLADYVSAMPGGTSREANIKLLVDRAVALKQSKLFGLPHFIHFIDEMIKNKGDMGIATTLGEGEDVVRLMSIHKSKGLEFPVVIIGGMGRKFNMMDTTGDLLLHKNLGIALSHVSLDLRTKTKTLPQFSVKEQMKIETLSEEMRVLYVGLTRAVDRLIVFSTVSDGEKKKQQWSRPLTHHALYHASGFCDWLMPVWMTHPLVHTQWLSMSDLAREEARVELTNQKKLAHWQNLFHQAKDKDLPQWVEKQLGHVYDIREKGYRPIKVSVSSLKNNAIQPNFDLVPAPAFLTKAETPSALEKGNAFHRVLECIHYQADYDLNAVKSFLKRLVDEGRLTQMAYESVSAEKIMSFLGSDLGIRIKRAIRYYKEVPFVLAMEGQLIQGVIDLYFETPEGVVLVDFKTDAIKGRSIKALADKYAFQLSYYAHAIERLSGRPVIEKGIYFIEAEAYHRLD